MSIQTEAQLFLAQNRGNSETNSFQSFHTFNFGQYRAEGREPFGALCLLNEDMIRPGANLTLTVEVNTEVILIPVVGGLEYQTKGQSDFLKAGQAGRFSLAAGASYTVGNPYETETITMLQLWLTSPTVADFAPGFQLTSFDLSIKNTLLPLFSTTGQQGFIGQFDGRAEHIFQVSNPTKSVFVFVIQGVFEVANRLLHAKDGLALHGVTEVEFEALSNDAILVLMEV